MRGLSGLVLACALGLAQASSAAAQSAPQPAPKGPGGSAADNCRANRGVDCDTPQGLREWELLERSREQAVRDGSRRLVRPPEKNPK